MKRYVLSLVVVGALMIAPASASAVTTALCSVSTGSSCPAANTYPAGTEVKAELMPGTQARITEMFGLNQAVCNASSHNFTLTEHASYAQSFTTNLFSFSECTNPIKVLNQRGGWISWTEGVNGTFVYAPEIELFWLATNQKCRFFIEQPVPITGGSSPTITFKKTPLHKVPTEPETCNVQEKGGAFFSGTYKITTPNPLYVRTL